MSSRLPEATDAPHPGLLPRLAGVLAIVALLCLILAPHANAGPGGDERLFDQPRFLLAGNEPQPRVAARADDEPAGPPGPAADVIADRAPAVLLSAGRRPAWARASALPRRATPESHAPIRAPPLFPSAGASPLRG
ncbi:hypothetical protein [Pontibaca methylaminivorans]|uniref:Uncharacterized protein n=1 Tax=Pontibaca methylaminivorans TaxID=515897 RepID=A0A1R3X5U6_9RHOB|nr:hypothetical protein [Pontibaca methylaminivorans]SIT84835.1 hypothetical protein SAMN05421849_2195 [Pontibaca methylaminivorans]